MFNIFCKLGFYEKTLIYFSWYVHILSEKKTSFNLYASETWTSSKNNKKQQTWGLKKKYEGKCMEPWKKIYSALEIMDNFESHSKTHHCHHWCEKDQFVGKCILYCKEKKETVWKMNWKTAG